MLRAPVLQPPTVRIFGSDGLGEFVERVRRVVPGSRDRSGKQVLMHFENGTRLVQLIVHCVRRNFRGRLPPWGGHRDRQLIPSGVNGLREADLIHGHQQAWLLLIDQGQPGRRRAERQSVLEDGSSHLGQ